MVHPEKSNKAQYLNFYSLLFYNNRQETHWNNMHLKES